MTYIWNLSACKQQQQQIRISLSNGSTSKYDQLLCRKAAVGIKEVQAPDRRSPTSCGELLKWETPPIAATHLHKLPLVQWVRAEHTLSVPDASANPGTMCRWQGTTSRWLSSRMDNTPPPTSPSQPCRHGWACAFICASPGPRAGPAHYVFHFKPPLLPIKSSVPINN